MLGQIYTNDNIILHFPFASFSLSISVVALNITFIRIEGCVLNLLLFEALFCKEKIMSAVIFHH